MSMHILLIILLLLLYGIVTLAVQNIHLVTEWDLDFGGWVISKNSPFNNRVFSFVTDLGTYKVIRAGTAILCLLLLSQKDWVRAVLLIALVGTTTLFNRYLKRIFPRIRPDFPQNYLYHVDLSYPSGHTMLATAFYAMAAYIGWLYGRGTWLGWIAIILAVLLVISIGFSRVYLGVHFLSDVLGGWIAGSLLFLSFLLLGNFFPIVINASRGILIF